MPLQIAEHNRAGDLWGSAFANLGAMIGAGLEKRKEEEKKIRAAISGSNSFAQALGLTEQEQAQFDALKNNPNVPDSDKAMALPQFIQGVQTKREEEKRKAEMALQQAQIEKLRNDVAMNAFAQQAIGRALGPQNPFAQTPGYGQKDYNPQVPSFGDAYGSLVRQGVPSDRIAGVKAAADMELAQQRLAKGADQTGRYREQNMIAGGKVFQTVFDSATGERFIPVPSGEKVPIPAGAEPITATGAQKDVPDINAFRKLKGEVTTSEKSLRSLNRYMATQEDTNIGLQRLADQFSRGIKTLVGEKKLDPKEIAVKAADGQMQGLLGQSRLQVVGGGVMTEQDALRIISYLGGEVDALQSPEVVRQAISNMYRDTYAKYSDDVAFYNDAVEQRYKANGYKPTTKIELPGWLAPDSEDGIADVGDGWVVRKK